LNFARWDGTTWRKPFAEIPGADEAAGEIHIGFTSSIDRLNGIYSIATFVIEGRAEVLIGGSAITNAGGVSVGNVAWWTGSAWSDLAGGTTGLVSAVLFDGSGSKFAAGNFNSIGGISARNIARFSGTAWEPLGDGLPFIPETLLMHNDQLYAGGYKSGTEGSTATLALWTGTEWLTVGTALGGPAPPRIRASLSVPSGIYVGGVFTNIGNVAVTNIARWTGTEWEGVPAAHRVRVNSLARQGSDILAGGSTLASEPAGIARWEGANWRFETNSPVQIAKTVAVSGDKILVRGQVNTGLEQVRNGTAYFDGTVWKPLGQGIEDLPSGNNNWRQTHFLSDEHGLSLAARWPIEGRGKIYRWDGELWNPIGKLLFFPSSIDAVDLQAGHYWVGTVAPGWLIPAASSIARTGETNWTGASQGFQVYDIVVAGAKVFAGGSQGLFEWNGSQFTRIASFTNGTVVSLATDGNTLYVAGRSPGTHFSVNRFDGQSWTTLASSVTNGTGRFELKLLDGSVHAYGSFTSIGGLPIKSVARWNGQQWQSVLPDGFPGTVFEVTSDGRESLYVAGFGARLQTNLYQVRGSTIVPVEVPAAVEALHWWRGALYLLGDFTSAMTVPSQSIAAWHDPEAAVEVIVNAPTNAAPGGIANVTLNVANLRETNLPNVRLTIPLAPGASSGNLPQGASILGTNLVLQIAMLPVGVTNFSLKFNLDGADGTNITFQVIAEADGLPTFRSSPAWTTIQDGNFPPQVALGSLPESVTLPDAATIRAVASDADGTIARVEFYANSSVIGSDSEGPYEIQWNPSIPGNYAIYAIAYDDHEKKTTSFSRNMRVLERPANDSFDNRNMVTNTTVTVSGTLLAATSEPIDPLGFGNTVWYEWLPGTAGIAAMSIVPSYLKIAVFRNTTEQPPVAFSGSNTTLPIRLVSQPEDRWIIVIGGTSGNSFQLQFQLSPLKPHDFFSNAKLLEGWEVREDVDTFGLTVEPEEPPLAGVPAERTLWFSWAAPMDGRVVRCSFADSARVLERNKPHVS
jgi:hypothetical protein